MKRYITINNHCGFIWGDTLGLPPKDRSPVEAAFDIDAENADLTGLAYQERSGQNDGNGCTVYEVPEGSTLPLVDNGQDQDMIELVTSTCKRVACVIAVDTETGRES